MLRVAAGGSYELGWAYRAAGRYTEAITTLQEFLSRKPDAMDAHRNLALSYWLQWLSQQSPADQTSMSLTDLIVSEI